MSPSLCAPNRILKVTLNLFRHLTNWSRMEILFIFLVSKSLLVNSGTLLTKTPLAECLGLSRMSSTWPLCSTAVSIPSYTASTTTPRRRPEAAMTSSSLDIHPHPEAILAHKWQIYQDLKDQAGSNEAMISKDTSWRRIT